MKKIIIANYKMNPLSVGDSVRLARAEDFPGVFIAPPAVFLAPVKASLRRARLAAQDVSVLSNSTGAATGEISAAQLKKAGVGLVLVGHSERRALGETDSEISQKIEAVLAAGLQAVLCVGEPSSVRAKGISAVKKFLEKQISSVSRLRDKKLIIAYEPIWAIGTGKSCAPSQTAEIAGYLKSFSGGRVLYGGSVSAVNAREFLAEPAIDGLLVGGLSLKPKEFKKIIF